MIIIIIPRKPKEQAARHSVGIQKAVNLTSGRRQISEDAGRDGGGVRSSDGRSGFPCPCNHGADEQLVEGEREGVARWVMSWRRRGGWKEEKKKRVGKAGRRERGPGVVISEGEVEKAWT